MCSEFFESAVNVPRYFPPLDRFGFEFSSIGSFTVLTQTVFFAMSVRPATKIPTTFILISVFPTWDCPQKG